MFGKTTEYCHVCNSPMQLKKNASLPPVCPICGADLANPETEKIVNTIECEHLKGAIGAGDGLLFASTKRLFFIKERKKADVGYDDDSYGAAANVVITAALNKGAGKVSVNIPLEDIVGIEDCKKGLRKGVTLTTKSGESYNFFVTAQLGKAEAVETLKEFFAPYING